MLWNGRAEWRHPAYLVSLYTPVIFLLVEICMNQLTLLWKHVTMQYAFTAVYLIVTAILQLAGSQEIYVAGFDWNCLKGSDTDPCQWGKMGSFFGLFLALQTAFFFAGLVVHVIKQKYCGCSPPDDALHERLMDKEA